MVKEPYTLLEDYAREIETDTHIDVTNIMTKQFSSPNIKHKWLYRLAMAKKDLLMFCDARDNYVNGLMSKDNNPIQLSKATIAKKAETQTDYRNLQSKIRQQEILCEYLESCVNKIFSQMGFDFKNLVELMKMEQL